MTRFLLLLIYCFLFASFLLPSSVTALDATADRLKLQAYSFYAGVGKPVNYARALDLYRQAALRGDSEAQFIYGGMLYKGLGTDVDKVRAYKWLFEAAEKGKSSPESMTIIGEAFLQGQGVPQNYLEAKKWLKPAAVAGNITAQNYLAYMLYNGLGGERDFVEALALYKKAAMKGDSQAQANVALMYAAGTGTEPDRQMAYAWYSIAASNGNTRAAVARNSLMADMNWEELNAAQALSVELYQQIGENAPKPGGEDFRP